MKTVQVIRPVTEWTSNAWTFATMHAARTQCVYQTINITTTASVPRDTSRIHRQKSYVHEQVFARVTPATPQPSVSPTEPLICALARRMKLEMCTRQVAGLKEPVLGEMTIVPSKVYAGEEFASLHVRDIVLLMQCAMW